MHRIKNLKREHWLGIGLALGVVGGLIFDNLAGGMMLGLLFGMLMGGGKAGEG